MFSLKLILTSVCAFVSVAQSQQFLIQNWGNGERATNYTYKSLEAGRYTVEWVLGAGGNFVVGKGYRGSQNLFVHPQDTVEYEPDYHIVWLTTPPTTIPKAIHILLSMGSRATQEWNFTSWRRLQSTILRIMQGIPSTAITIATVLYTNSGPSITVISANTSLLEGLAGTL
jgi:hypothetical protein